MATVTDDTIAPGKLSLLMISGPDPWRPIAKDDLEFVKSHGEHGTTVLAICTGTLVAAQSGIVDGRKASGPRALVPDLRKKFPNVQWDIDRRWVRDGHV